MGFAILAALLALAGCTDAPPEVSRMERAQQALARGDGIGAEEYLRAAMAAGTGAEDVAALLGEAALEQDDLAKARRWLDGASFSAATAAHGYRMLGRLEMREARLAEAGAAFDRALAIEPDDAELWVDIGHLRYRGGEHLQAIEAADRALRIDPANPAALRFRAQLVRDSQGPLAALPWLERALKRAPDDLALMTERAATLGEVGRASEALEVLRRVAQRDARAPRLFYLQAVIAARGGNPRLARDLLSRAPQDEREAPAGQLLGGVLDLHFGNHASAAQTFDRLAQSQPDNRMVTRLLAEALAMSGGERELVARFQSRADARQASPYIQTAVGRALETLDRRAEAAPYLDAAAQPRNPAVSPLPSGRPLEVVRHADLNNGAALRDYLRAMLPAGEGAEAARQASAFAARFPGSSDAQNLLGDAQLAAGDMGAAIDAYRSAARIRRDWPLIQRLMAAQLALGDRQGASATLRAFLEGGAREPMAAALYAEWLAREGDLARAGSLLDSALAHGAAPDPSVLALRSEVARSVGDGEGALAFAARAYDIQPLFPPAIRALALSTDDADLRERLRRKLARIESR